MPKRRWIARWLMVVGAAYASLPAEVHAQWHDADQERWTSLQQIKANSLAAADDPDAALAHDVFARLLRAWDSPRLAPTLHVVDAGQAVWAASLDDGSILISRRAVAVARGAPSSTARLAFVLAHELGHQQSDHLWRQRYFRLAGESTGRVSGVTTSTRDEAAVLYEQERQADADGLVLMVLAGFDPHAIVADADFFDDWIASVQGQRCSGDSARVATVPACEEAARRIAEARTRLTNVAIQSALFELGIQAYAFADYRQALNYFTAFGRTFPAPAVYANLGLAHLALALQLRRDLVRLQGRANNEFTYPLVLSSRALPESVVVQRGNSHSKRLQDIRREIAEQTAAAVTSFDKVIGLRPQDEAAYLHLAAAYLADDNVAMAKGVIDGRYGKRFAVTAASTMLQAAVAQAEGQRESARALVEKAIAMLQGNARQVSSRHEAQLFTAYENLAALLSAAGSPDDAQQRWVSLADWANRRGLPVLFETARQRAREPVVVAAAAAPLASNVAPFDGARDFDLPYLARLNDAQEYTLWSDGERLSLRVFNDGTHLVLDDAKRLRAAWLRYPSSDTKLPDAQRIVARYGVPDRVTMGDERLYLTFQQSALGFEMSNRAATGWFRYVNSSPLITGGR